jgi:capsular polysaccharide transport system permease protein
MTESILRPLHVWLNVINALLLRDIRARAGKFYTGYLVVFLMPFAHLAVVLTIYVFAKRAPPVGTDATMFFGLSILPFVIFVYPSRQIVVGLAQNRPLLYFPRVKIFDIIFARALLETANGAAVSAMTLFVLFLATGGFEPRDPFGLECAVILTIYVGIAWGAYNSLLAVLAPFWMYAFNLCFPALWLLSGGVLNVYGFPSEIQYYFAFNPLFQCVEYLRYSYYEGYPTHLLNVSYAFWFGTCLLAAALVLERLMRRHLLSA